LKSNPKAIHFCGILYADAACRNRALDALISKFGPFRHESPAMPWHSGHYSGELGAPVMRQFVFFRDIVLQDALKGLKKLTRSIEDDLSVEGKRKVNLDPGIVAPARVVLATTKDYAHRIYLGEGIFAEATLTYRKGRFIPAEFAYSDYTHEGILELFGEIRGELIRETEK
jgi:hypothetical protein